MTKKSIVYVDSGESKENTKSGPSKDSDGNPLYMRADTDEEINALFHPYLPIAMFKS